MVYILEFYNNLRVIIWIILVSSIILSWYICSFGNYLALILTSRNHGNSLLRQASTLMSLTTYISIASVLYWFLFQINSLFGIKFLHISFLFFSKLTWSNRLLPLRSTSNYSTSSLFSFFVVNQFWVFRRAPELSYYCIRKLSWRKRIVLILKYARLLLSNVHCIWFSDSFCPSSWVTLCHSTVVYLC